MTVLGTSAAARSPGGANICCAVPPGASLVALELLRTTPLRNRLQPLNLGSWAGLPHDQPLPSRVACMSRFSRPSASALGRFLQLGGTGARIAGNLLVQRIPPGKARIDWGPVGEMHGVSLGALEGTGAQE